MISHLKFLVVVLALSAAVHAQQPTSANSTVQKAQEVEEGDILRTTTNLVAVPVIVVDRQGRHIVDLRQSDFRIFENGVEQNIAHFSSVENPFSVGLLIDTSGSTAPFLDQIKNAAKTFVEQLRPSDVVRPVYFHGEVKPLIDVSTNDRNVLAAAIDRIEPGPVNLGTRLYDAVAFSLADLKSETRRKALVLLTDGQNTWGKATMKGTLREAEESHVIVYTMQFDDAPTDRYLVELAHRTGGRYYKAADISLIKQSFASIAEELRRQYLIGYYISDASKRGERKIKVKVNRKNVAVVMRKSA